MTVSPLSCCGLGYFGTATFLCESCVRAACLLAAPPTYKVGKSCSQICPAVVASSWPGDHACCKVQSAAGSASVQPWYSAAVSVNERRLGSSYNSSRQQQQQQQQQMRHGRVATSRGSVLSTLPCVVRTSLQCARR
eukprot:10533-Heterococcus_DN1.PRE.2